MGCYTRVPTCLPTTMFPLSFVHRCSRTETLLRGSVTRWPATSRCYRKRYEAGDHSPTLTGDFFRFYFYLSFLLISRIALLQRTFPFALRYSTVAYTIACFFFFFSYESREKTPSICLDHRKTREGSKGDHLWSGDGCFCTGTFRCVSTEPSRRYVYPFSILH